jgi:RNase adaptor protein for sRNA GlmZ degradation
MEVKVQRKHFTRHGQHLNQSEKELVSSELAKLIEQQQTEVENNPIQMQWKEEGFYEGIPESQNCSVELVELPNYDYHVKSINLKGKKKKRVSTKCH